MTKETFEQRMEAMQHKMEEQLVEQLRTLETKINSPMKSVNGGFSAASVTEGGNNQELGQELTKKELEIIRLNKQILDMQSNEKQIEEKTLARTESFKMEGNPTENLKKINDLTAQNATLKAAVEAAERMLAVSENRAQSTEERVAELEGEVVRERKAKEEAMELFNDNDSVTEIVNKDVVTALEFKRKEDQERIAKLEQDVKRNEEQKVFDIAQLEDAVKNKEAMLQQALENISNMKEEEINGMNLREEMMNDMKNDFLEEKQNLQAQLQEQQLLRLSQTTELEQAKEAKAKMIEEMKLNQQKIQEASGLLENNERLHKALGIETERRKALHNKIEDMKGRIRVYVRIRPLSKSEEDKKCEISCRNEGKKTCLILPDEDAKDQGAKTWDFDSVFCGQVKDGNTQANVFKDTSHLITSAVDGFNVCIFAYGQTGSGKTFTMFGAGGVGGGIDENGVVDELTGLAPRAASELFKVLKEREASSLIEVKATMFELYNDALVDLLAPKVSAIDNPNKLVVKLAEHSGTGMVEVQGSVEEEVKDVNDLLGLFQRGAKARTVAATQMNADSSRSHLITCIVTKVTNKRSKNVVAGKLTLVDLAGSERVGKSGATGQQLKEAQSINKSLSALGDVISALTTSSKHVPYRNHPLTMLMSDSIGGNAKTLMFVCCSPADYNRSESANSLDFAKRCKDVKNYSQGSDQTAQLLQMKKELARLRKEGGGGGPPGHAPPKGPPPKRHPTGPPRGPPGSRRS